MEGPAVLADGQTATSWRAAGMVAAAISVVIGEGLKPLTTSHTPSDSSHAATGSAAAAARAEPCSMAPNSVANTAMISRGAPMSPINGDEAGHEAGAVHQGAQQQCVDVHLGATTRVLCAAVNFHIPVRCSIT